MSDVRVVRHVAIALARPLAPASGLDRREPPFPPRPSRSIRDRRPGLGRTCGARAGFPTGCQRSQPPLPGPSSGGARTLTPGSRLAGPRRRSHRARCQRCPATFPTARGQAPAPAADGPTVTRIDLRKERRSGDTANATGGDVGSVGSNDGNPARDAEEAVTLAEAARLVGKSVQALRARVKRGTLPTIEVERDGRKVTAIPRDALLQEYPEAVNRPATDDRESDVASQRSQPEVDDTAGVGEGKTSTAIVSVVEVPVEELTDLRSRASRTDIAESALHEERQERRATLMALARSQERIQLMLEEWSAEVPTAKADRKVVYSVVAIAVVGICAMGWRLHAVDAVAAVTAQQRDALAVEHNSTLERAAKAEGSVESLRETLRDEQDRTLRLERELESGERAARAMGETVVRIFGGE